jgi:hypothetical protein
MTRVPPPPRAPNLNPYAERWVRSVTEEVLSRLILFGERALRHAFTPYEAHYHQERPIRVKAIRRSYLLWTAVRDRMGQFIVGNGSAGC